MNQGYEQIGVAVTCRSFEEYVRMFDLRENELERAMLDIAGGSVFLYGGRDCTRDLDAYAADPRYALDSQSS